ncbi:MAG: Smr/MutS family protein [Clostridia bacterium]|nr:Smr/MutS family protein [Clostridia bacterium]
MDKYLDTCTLNGLEQIRIVHGKGTRCFKKRNSRIFKNSSSCKIF